MKNITREEALELWLTTLEQHPERQTTSVLGRVEEKYCCLGQLCEILLEDEEKEIFEDTIDYLGNEIDLPYEVVNFMGFIDSIGGFPESYELDNGAMYKSLADMNDRDITWPEIAKFIRENPEKVFVS